MAIAAIVGVARPPFLVNNLLLINQFPDVDADRSIGRDNFPVAVTLVTLVLVAVGFLIA